MFLSFDDLNSFAPLLNDPLEDPNILEIQACKEFRDISGTVSVDSSDVEDLSPKCQEPSL